MSGVKIDQYMDLGPPGTQAVAGTAAKLTTDVEAKMVAFQADAGNTGSIFLGRDHGPESDRTVITSTILLGWELQPGESSPWMPAGNINEWSAIADSAGDVLRWITLV